ncbi:MAG TPA: sterol desaturase family protein [Puia sp.]|nr:sterol desaturase family protein [Puia sp.]
METYGKILLYAMPSFLALVLFEKWWGWHKGNDTVRSMDMISSLTSGITNVTKDVLGLSLVILSYGWLVSHAAITHIKSGILTYFVAFLSLDFAGYWSHRIAHHYNFFWNSHIIHHSSEEFNLACALRQSISVFVQIFGCLLLPAALVGVPEKVIIIVAPLHLFAQFWYHTRHINKLGFLEKFIVTPSHHRVHHAINKEYIDKNFGQIFIFWDKLFGSFQAEIPGLEPVYGITRPVNTWNPIKINFQHLILLTKDAWRTKLIKDKIRIWIMPTGWRPEDVAKKYPVSKIDNVYKFRKYAPPCSSYIAAWSWVQLTVLLLLISYLFGHIALIGSPGVFYYGAFVFLAVYSMTDMMDRNPYAIIPEIIKSLFGWFLIIENGDWFGLSSYSIPLENTMMSYLSISPIVVAFMTSRISYPQNS